MTSSPAVNVGVITAMLMIGAASTLRRSPINWNVFSLGRPGAC